MVERNVTAIYDAEWLVSCERAGTVEWTLIAEEKSRNFITLVIIGFIITIFLSITV